MPVAIKVESIAKAYQLGEYSTGTLSRDIERAWYRVRGKEDPFLKLGETNDRTRRGGSDIVWSLRNIDFEINAGDAVGIVGRNGAGKSTLLKILSRVTTPSAGKIKIKGRISSLLEVGTGFHPELTGKENIFLNGAILGMRKAEIKKRFDEIVDFSGVERYLDTPVKRYSSGMYVRLAFAVAAHLESEILIVDEVLAVGDAEFQKRCLGKMGDVSKGEGKTVLFVSHNMAAVKQLCSRGILLKNGELQLSGNVDEIISTYQRQGIDQKSTFLKYAQLGATLHERIRVNEILINGQQSGDIGLSEANNQLQITINLDCFEDTFLAVEAKLKDESGLPLASFSSAQVQAEIPMLRKGNHQLKTVVGLPSGIMKGDYYFSLFLSHPGYEFHFVMEDMVMICHEGFSTKAGVVLNYREGHGWLLLS